MSRGHDRERLVRDLLEAGIGPYDCVDPWWVIRSAGSLGNVDLAASRSSRGARPATELILVEVKSDHLDYGPFNNFGPARQQGLIDAAGLASAQAWLCYVPPATGAGLWGAWIPDWQWPINR